MSVDPHLVGSFRIGYTRIGVIEPLFESWIAQGRTVEVTRRRRQVSDTSDLYTAHPNVTWTEVEDVDAVIRFGPAGSEALDIGVVGQLDGTITTADAFRYRDQFDYLGVRYTIISPFIRVPGSYGSFLYRKAAFRRSELEEP